MAKFRVEANPKGGTVHQEVHAKNPGEAIRIAKGRPNGWLVSHPKNESDWEYNAHAV